MKQPTPALIFIFLVLYFLASHFKLKRGCVSHSIQSHFYYLFWSFSTTFASSSSLLLLSKPQTYLNIKNDSNGQLSISSISFKIFEEEAIGHVVGDLAVTLASSRNIHNVTFSILRQSYKGDMLFHIDRISGQIKTENKVDREIVCAPPFVPTSILLHSSNVSNHLNSQFSSISSHYPTLYTSTLSHNSELKRKFVLKKKRHVYGKVIFGKQIFRKYRKNKIKRARLYKIFLKNLKKNLSFDFNKKLMEVKNNCNFSSKHKNHTFLYNSYCINTELQHVQKSHNTKLKRQKRYNNLNDEKKCMVTLSVAMKKGKDTKILNVKIEIQDINDHSPFFLNNTISLEVSESVQVHHYLLLPPVYDLDAGLNGEVHIMIDQKIPTFQVVHTKKQDNSVQVKLIILEKLDREKIDSYAFKVGFLNGFTLFLWSFSLKLFITINLS